MPIVEIAAIIAVGRVIGGWQTLLLLVLESMLGAWIVKREGVATWAALQEALRSGRMPSRQLSDAALVLIGGTLLLTPGFVTDIVGFFFVLPLTRPITRAWLEASSPARLLGPMGEWPTDRPGHARHRTPRADRHPGAFAAALTAATDPTSSRVRSSTATRRRDRPRAPDTSGCRAPTRGPGTDGGRLRRTCACAGRSPRDSRRRVRRSSRSSSSSGIERRSSSMSQWVRTCLTGLASGSGPPPWSLASAPQRHSQVCGTSASTENGSLMVCPFGHR